MRGFYAAQLEKQRSIRSPARSRDDRATRGLRLTGRDGDTRNMHPEQNCSSTTLEANEAACPSRLASYTTPSESFILPS